MYISLENKLREDGCSSMMPWIRSKVWMINKSFCPSFDFPSSLSKQLTNRSATFHSNPSCNLKNSLNAGSWLRSLSSFRGGGSLPGSMTLRRLSAEEFDEEDRHICASRPSTWRSPLRILDWSYEERLSKERESSASILPYRLATLGCWVLVLGI